MDALDQRGVAETQFGEAALDRHATIVQVRADGTVGEDYALLESV